MDAVCLIIRKAPYGKIHAAEAVRHVNGALASGLETRVILVGDGVYLARGNQKAAEAGWTSLSGTLSQVPQAKGGANAHFYHLEKQDLLVLDRRAVDLGHLPNRDRR